MQILEQSDPQVEEIRTLFSLAFDELSGNDSEKFADDQNQSLSEWFSVEEMMKYLRYGVFLEAREGDKLIGAAFIAKQHPISWPDGKKAELFVIAVLPEYRNQQIGKMLLERAEESAVAFGATGVIVNTNELMDTVTKFYERNGYQPMGVLQDYYDNGNAKFFYKRLS